jgi:hypothetical protein
LVEQHRDMAGDQSVRSQANKDRQAGAADRIVQDIDAVFFEQLRDVHVGLKVVLCGRIVRIERLLQRLSGGQTVR